MYQYMTLQQLPGVYVYCFYTDACTLLLYPLNYCRRFSCHLISATFFIALFWQPTSKTTINILLNYTTAHTIFHVFLPNKHSTLMYNPIVVT